MKTFGQLWERHEDEVFGRTSSLVHLLRVRWEELVGTLASASRPERLYRGTLTVLVRNPALRLALERLAPRLLEDLAAAYPRVLVSRLKFQVGDFPETDLPPGGSETENVVEVLTPEERRRVEQILADGEEGPLKEVFRRLITAQLLRERKERKAPAGEVSKIVEPPPGQV
jgi:hypothetical protein